MKKATPKERKPSQSEKKILNEIENFFYTSFFQKEISKLRKKYKIPENGFKISEYENTFFEEKTFLYLPKQLKNQNEKNNIDLAKNINKDINKNIIYRFEFKSIFLYSLTKYYLFFDKFNEDINLIGKKVFKKDNLIRLINFKEWDSEYGEGLEHIEKSLLGKPIGLLFNNRISQRDLISFIKTNWNLIEEEFNTHYGKIDTENILNKKNLRVKNNKRNKIIKETIAKNSNKKNKDIAKILSKEKIYLDEGNIYNYKKKISK